MKRMPNRVGGGAITNLNGLRFEKRADLRDAIKSHSDYEMHDDEVVEISTGLVVARYFEKHGLYKNLLQANGVNWKNIISAKLLPDSALLVGETMYIIEKKYQARAGSVDEKLQTCHFKKQQYEKLLYPLGISVEYYYVLNEWFDQPKFADVFEYIEQVGCRYFLVEIPIDEIGL